MQHFLRARASIAIARIRYGNSVSPSVRLSVRQSRPGTNPRPGEIEISSFHHMIAYCLQYLAVFREKNSSRWIKEIPANEGLKRGSPLQKALFYRFRLV